MPKLIIDNQEIEVDNGATILDAAEKLGIEIPTMCFLKGYKPSTSCMVCVVKVVGLDNLVPACGTIAEDDMRVESNSKEVYQARKAALELLLSDHVGDCVGPCQMTCPANMNIPLMIRQIASGKLSEAIATVKKDIALPAVLGRICPAPCERACRRAVYDEAVSICLLKQYVADVDLQSSDPYLPACKPMQDKRVAIIGAGPAGLAAAYYLRQQGHGCTIFDEREKPGGMLQYAVPEEELPRNVLDKEISVIEKLGVEFQGRTRVGTTLDSRKAGTLSMDDLRKDFDAVFVAVGKLKPSDAPWLGLETEWHGLPAHVHGQDGRVTIVINAKTYETSLPGVFAGGDAVWHGLPARVHGQDGRATGALAVQAVADGKEAAVSIGQFLSGQTVTGAAKLFNTRIGQLKNGEIETFMARVSKAARVIPCGTGFQPVYTAKMAVPRQNGRGGFMDTQARQEAARCMHCDCRKAQSCKLRQYAQHGEARPSRYKGQRRSFIQHFQHPDVIYEPGKCINCGLCIQIAAEAGEELGLTFVGRGFDVQVAVPFDRSMAEALKHTANRCVAACPTGALAFKDST